MQRKKNVDEEMLAPMWGSPLTLRALCFKKISQLHSSGIAGMPRTKGRSHLWEQVRDIEINISEYKSNKLLRNYNTLEPLKTICNVRRRSYIEDGNYHEDKTKQRKYLGRAL